MQNRCIQFGLVAAALCSAIPVAHGAYGEPVGSGGAFGGLVLAEDPEPVLIKVGVGRGQPFQSPWRVEGVSLIDPAVADVEVLSPELLVITGRGVGVTDLLLWNAEGEIEQVTIVVEADPSAISKELQQFFPDSRLDVAQSGRVTVLSGTLARAEQALQLQSFLEARGVEYVDMTSVAGVQQVQVQVRMAEVSRTGLRALGVNGFGAGENGFAGSTIGSDGGGAINPVSVGPPAGAPVGSDLPFEFSRAVEVSPAVTLFGGSLSNDFMIFVQALAENQYLRILAEPNLVALSGQEASFLAGGEFPIPVVQGGTGVGNSVTIEYKEFGVGLKFRPTVLGDGRIRLQVASEVSELSDVGALEISGFRIPSVVTRRADTTLELSSGETFAMAGLLSESSSAVSSKIPGLGSLPILGSLFRSVRYKRGETELLLLVTASLVEPLSGDVLAPLPGTTHVVPSDWELYALGRIEGAAPARISADTQHWLEDSGLDRLRGPGAWINYGQEPARARTDRQRTGSTTQGARPE